LALANSRRHAADGVIVDDLRSAASTRAWLSAHGLPRGGRPAVGPLRELRVGVRELLLARIEGRTPDPAALGTVNAGAAAAPAAVRLAWEGEPRAERAFVGATGLDLARARLAADAIELVTGPDADDLRACEAPGCVRLLLRDHPRRHWCSTRCGDRVRARRYYHRHHAASG
jgi:predicted RNA-binding Zn ribbon-like protein